MLDVKLDYQTLSSKIDPIIPYLYRPESFASKRLYLHPTETIVTARLLSELIHMRLPSFARKNAQPPLQLFRRLFSRF